MSGTASVRSARLARVVHLISLVVLSIVIVLTLLPTGGTPPDPVWGLATIVVVGGYSTLGRLIVTRASNLIGWVFLAMAAAAVVGLPAEAYLQGAFEQPYVATLPGTRYAGWLANLAPALIALSIPMLFLLFPTGSPPSRRWRWVGWVWLVGAVLSFVWLAFRPDKIYGEPGRFSIENPFSIALLRPLGPLFLNVGAGCALIAGAAAIASLVVRFQRSRGDERQQIKWLMAVGVAGLTILVLMFVLEAVHPAPAAGDEGLDDYLWVPLVLVAVLGPAAATAIAVFRYRLYGIDVVIRKTVVFGALAVFITGVYIGVVVGIGSFLGRGDESNVALQIAATAIVAIAFQPVRERVQRFANRLVYGKRATPYEVLARFSERVAGTYATEDVLPRTARVIAEGTGASRVDVWLRVADELRPAATWPEDAEPRDPARLVGLSTLGAGRTVEVRLGDELLGAITVDKPASEPFTPAEDGLLNDLAGQTGLVLSNVRLTAELESNLERISRQAAELRASRQRIVVAQDAERRRLERNIHDGAQQHLVALAVKLRLARQVVAKDAAKGRAMLLELHEQLDEALETLTSLALGIYPPLLEEQGIAAALAAQYARSGLPVHMVVDGARRYPIETEAAVYFCVLEALQNAAKYANASRIDVRLEERDGELWFEVADDGAGFDPAINGGGTGLRGMHDRLSVLGGDAEIDSTPGRGTTVRGRVPIAQLEAAR